MQHVCCRVPENVNQNWLAPENWVGISKKDFNTLDNADTLAAVSETPSESTFHNEHEHRSANSEPPSRQKKTFWLQKQKQLT